MSTIPHSPTEIAIAKAIAGMEQDNKRLRAVLQTIAEMDSGAWAAGKHRKSADQAAYFECKRLAAEVAYK